MNGLNLVIADKDQSYLDSVVDFINLKYQNRFYIQAFSNETAFNDYIKQVNRIDILLISPDFYYEDMPWEKIVAAVVLSSGILAKEINNCEIISKYQTGDKLVASILNIFSEKSKSEIYIHDGSKKTKIVTFFSPVGGSGKSTLAVGASVQSAANGMEVFYLNLERFPTTTAFFYNEGTQNLSNILFYVKENSKNLTLKIEGSRSIDPATGVHYFLPPENIFDIDDISKDEMGKLLNQLKALGCYDVIVVDIGPELSDINISILENSDSIFLILPHDPISKIKTDTLMQGFEILEKRKGIKLLNKLEVVINKYTSSVLPEIDDININERPVIIKIPYIKGFDIRLGSGYLRDSKNTLSGAISQIVNKF